jgi:S1-C subfamily serine protease
MIPSRVLRVPPRWPCAAAVLVLVAACLPVVVPPALAQPLQGGGADRAKAAAPIDAARIMDAIVRVSVNAVPDARSAATLGSEREGTGVVIGERGLILTIGYLIVEADDVTVTDRRGRTQAARVVGYDHASGLGLLRTIAPLAARPIPFGDSTRLAELEPVMIAGAGEDGIAFAVVVSKRAFSANWEYALDQAIYTSPPTLNWSGAALIDRKGKLLGVGSLMVRDATPEDPKLPGNMFVPIDVLKPILSDLVRAGHRAGPARPWLGVAADEAHGHLVVTRVSPEGPAERAGIAVGDVILAVGNERVSTQQDFYNKVWSRGSAGTDIPLRIIQGREIRMVQVASIDRVAYFRPRTTY